MTVETRNEAAAQFENMFKFQSPTSSSSSSSFEANLGSTFLPISAPACKSLSPSKVTRKISKVPFKILDAPSLQDDFYLNLVDWSPNNLLSVGLGSSVYLWSACTSKVTKLCDFEHDAVTSVSWARKGIYFYANSIIIKWYVM